GGVASVATAFVYAELGGRFPHAGGIYVFLREGFGTKAGPFVAFQYGWLQLLVIQPGSMGVIALILIDNVAFLTGPMPPWLRLGAAMFAIVVFTAATPLGLKTGGPVQVLIWGFKLGALAVLVIIGMIWGNRPGLVTAPPEPAAGPWFKWLIVGLIPVLFSFGGAYHGTFIAGSVRNPERSVPRGILLGIAVVLV